MVEERFSRTALLVGEEGVSRLAAATVAVFGLGGVGGYVCEALARAGIGHLILVDHDVISRSNINRQILADEETVGRPKVEVAAERAKKINPAAFVTAVQRFVLSEELEGLFADCRPDYIVDAIDTVTGKVGILRYAAAAGIPAVSCMGTGNKLEPETLQISDISRTHTCPLARAVRARLRREGILHADVLWSSELPRKPVVQLTENGRHIPASVSFVPGVAGLMLGGFVVRRLLGIPDHKKM